MEQKFYICETCGNIVGVVANGGGTLACCGKPMKELVANTVEASTEKHKPVYTVKGNKVEVVVGSVAHPMAEAHYIQWVSLQTKSGNQRKELKPGQEPKATFSITEGDEVVAVYAYCNLHGLWKAD
jgi:superoxide reductase